MEMNARQTALHALLSVSENEGYSNIVIDKAIRAAALPPRDAALASVLFYGVLEKRLTLDWYLRKCLEKPHQVIEETVLQLLYIALYQLLFLDKIPESAAVNEAVQLAAGYRGGRYKGFVNGVLRGFLRRRETLGTPDARSVRYNLPEALLEMWTRDYGGAVCEKLCAAFSQRAETYLRVNTLKTDAAALCAALPPDTAEPVREMPDAVRVQRAGDLTATEAFQNGLFHVQDLSSQMLCAWLDPQPGERVADVCAAPGGKSFTLAQRMRDKGRLDAFDLYKGRVRLIRTGAARLGLTMIAASARDALTGSAAVQYDRVLCDAPCSGLGVLRRKPEIRYKDPESFRELPRLQLGILSNSAALVRPGGLLFYSTCTLNTAENNAVAAAFLERHTDFAPHKLSGAEKLRVLAEPENMCTLMPYVHGGDGFFVAAFRKNDL